MRTLDEKCYEIFKAQVEVEKCMLQNKLIKKRERGDTIYRINLVKQNRNLHPWFDYEIEASCAEEEWYEVGDPFEMILI